MELSHLSSVSGSHVKSSPAKNDLFILQINIHKRKKNNMYSSKEGTRCRAWADELESVLSTIFQTKNSYFRTHLEMLRKSKCKQSKTLGWYSFLKYHWVTKLIYKSLEYLQDYFGTWIIKKMHKYLDIETFILLYFPHFNSEKYMYFSLIIYILLNCICICRDMDNVKCFSCSLGFFFFFSDEGKI